MVKKLKKKATRPIAEPSEYIGRPIIKFTTRIWNWIRQKFYEIDMMLYCLLYVYKYIRYYFRAKLLPVYRGIKSLIQRQRYKGYAVKGFPNLGRTCFFNAVLQNLLALDVLRDYYVQESVTESFGPFSVSTRNLFLQSTVGPGVLTGHQFDPRPLYGIICTKFPNIYNLDSGGWPTKLLPRLIFCLSSEEKVTQNHHRSVLDTMFRVEQATVTCSSTCRPSISHKSSLCLSLEVPYMKLQTSPTSGLEERCYHDYPWSYHFYEKISDISVPIESCLDLYMKPKYQTVGKTKNRSKTLLQRMLRKVRTDSRKLGKLSSSKSLFNVKRDMVKVTLISKAPPILTIKVNYVMHDSDRKPYRFDGRVKFGETLDLKPYMDPSCCNDTNDDTYMYRLVGLVEDSICLCGSDAHATAYVRGDRGNGQYAWYYVSDYRVLEVPVEKVLQAHKIELLFYERC